MPELPEITVYVESLAERITGQTLLRVGLVSPFLLRTVGPSLEECWQQQVTGIRQLGKRIAIGLENDLWLVLHLMVAGRLQWKDGGAAAVPGKIALATFAFTSGTLILTEAGSRKQASLHVVRGAELDEYDPGGIEVLSATLDEFAQALTTTNRTLKRQLTSPMLFTGIGNAYADEILHRARLSPVAQTQKLTHSQIAGLHAAAQTVLREWIERLRTATRGRFPAKVTAFRAEMAVHGKFGQPCPVCGSPVQRIVFAENETNYCATCQTQGKVLADRSLSRLLKDDWPRRIEDWE